MSKRLTIEVAQFDSTEKSRRATTSGVGGSFWTRALGLTGSLCLHGLLLQAIVLGSHPPHVKPPPEAGAGASRVLSPTPATETLVLIQVLNSVATDQDLYQPLSSNGALSKNIAVAILSPDPLPPLVMQSAPDNTESTPAAILDAGDVAGRTLLFGRYTGQIDARIRRVWRRPRSPVSETRDESGADSANASKPGSEQEFSCQVRIRQDAIGNVEETEVLHCNGSLAWQHSLIVAINESSPLPAPPDRAVFSSALVMTFTSTAYRPGEPSDEYEREIPVVAVSRNATPDNAASRVLP